MSGIEVGLLVLFGAVVFLDTWPAVQTMISRPLVVGPVVGWILGEPAAGAFWGAVFETLYLGSMPVGASRVPDAGLASLVGTVVAIQGRLDGVEAAVLAVGFGLAAGVAGERVDRWHRTWNGRTAERIARSVAGGDPDAPGRGIVVALLRGGAFGAVQTAVAVALALAALDLVETTWVAGRLPTWIVRVVAVAAAAMAGARLFVRQRIHRIAWSAGLVAGALVAWGAA
ncbi:MAG: PTS sugar transporter subunit IIC [Gemmatimonadota bacterium]|nr:PTS sugar transporter subunit IIC [Gemmatimonadota bacterium]